MCVYLGREAALVEGGGNEEDVAAGEVAVQDVEAVEVVEGGGDLAPRGQDGFHVGRAVQDAALRAEPPLVHRILHGHIHMQLLHARCFPPTLDFDGGCCNRFLSKICDRQATWGRSNSASFSRKLVLQSNLQYLHLSMTMRDDLNKAAVRFTEHGMHGGGEGVHQQRPLIAELE